MKNTNKTPFATKLMALGTILTGLMAVLGLQARKRLIALLAVLIWAAHYGLWQEFMALWKWQTCGPRMAIPKVKRM